MTKKEAIEAIKANYPSDRYTVLCAALDLAINALDQETALDKISSEIKKWYWQADKQALAKDPCVVDAMIDLFIRTINKYRAKSEEEEVCDNKDTGNKNDVIIVQIDCLMPMENVMAFRKDLLAQMEDGIIVIPPWAHVSHVGDECKIEVKEMEEKRSEETN